MQEDHDGYEETGGNLKRARSHNADDSGEESGPGYTDDRVLFRMHLLSVHMAEYLFKCFAA